MTDNLIKFFIDLFYEIQDKGRDGYFLIAMSVPMEILFKLYEKLIKVDVAPIETLPEEEKLKYWNKARQYHSSEEKAIKASKAAYILSLITNS